MVRRCHKQLLADEKRDSGDLNQNHRKSFLPTSERGYGGPSSAFSFFFNAFATFPRPREKCKLIRSVQESDGYCNLKCGETG